MWEGVAIDEIDPALGRPDGDAEALVLACVLEPERSPDRARQDRAPAQTRIARVGVEKAFVDARGLAPPEGDDGALGALIGDRDLAVGTLGSSSGREALALLRLDRAEEAKAAGRPLSAAGVDLALAE